MYCSQFRTIAATSCYLRCSKSINELVFESMAARWTLHLSNVFLSRYRTVAVHYVPEKGSQICINFSEKLISFPLFQQPSIQLIYYVQMFLHSQCIYLILVTLILTALGVRSSFILMFDVIFYSASTLLNVLSGLQHKGK